MMKKHLFRMVIVSLLLLCLSGTAPAEESEEETPGWTITETAEITEDARAAFESAKAELADAAYEPVALLGQQQDVYCILCRATGDYEDAKPYYTLVYAGKAACRTPGICGLKATASRNKRKRKKRGRRISARSFQISPRNRKRRTGSQPT